MTLNLPDLEPFGYRPWPDAQPFTQRAASGYQETLEELVTFTQRKLIPYLRDTNPNSAIWDGNVKALIAALDKQLTDHLSGIALSTSETGLVILVDDDGTIDHAPAIQTALDSGLDVHVVGTGPSVGVATVGSTLTMNPNALNQRFTTSHATLYPTFVGDVVQVTTKSVVSVAIDGSRQPSTGDFSAIAGIKIGGTSRAYNPMQAAVSYCDIRNMKGSGIIWEQGAEIAFDHTFIADVTLDGINCTANFDDNNHGNFFGTHVIRAGRVGYWVQYGNNGVFTDTWNGGLVSSAHLFANAKAFQCGTNFLIEGHSCVGSVFSEIGVNPDTFASTSRGNAIEVIETNAAFEGWRDYGQGNELRGFANGSYRTYVNLRTRSLWYDRGGARVTGAQSGVTNIGSVTIAAGGTAQIDSGVNGFGDHWTFRHGLFTSSTNGLIVQPHVTAQGALMFTLVNLTGASTTFTGAISWVAESFA